MENFITIYFNEDYEPSETEIAYFEKAIGCEISDGDGFVNVYTQDMSLVNDLVDLIGDFYITEIAS